MGRLGRVSRGRGCHRFTKHAKLILNLLCPTLARLHRETVPGGPSLRRRALVFPFWDKGAYFKATHVDATPGTRATATVVSDYQSLLSTHSLLMPAGLLPIQ